MGWGKTRNGTSNGTEYGMENGTDFCVQDTDTDSDITIATTDDGRKRKCQ